MVEVVGNDDSPNGRDPRTWRLRFSILAKGMQPVAGCYP